MLRIGGAKSYWISVGDKHYSSLTEDDPSNVLEGKSSEILPPQKLSFTFLAPLGFASAGLTVSFGENGRVEKVN